LSFIPSGSAVTSAYLTLYHNPTSINTGHSTMSGANNALVTKITSPWSESDVTWVNQPPVTNLHQSVLPASTSATQDYLNIDVKSLMQDLVDNPESNYGMMIQLATESPYRSLIFASSDHANATLHPKLEITFSPNITECISYQYSNCNGKDAEIGSCIPTGNDTTNFGTSAEFDALTTTESGANSDIRSLIFWDLSNIPSNAIVTSATSTLFWNPTSINAGHSVLSGSNEANLIKVTSQWSEDAITWNTQPSIDTTNQVYVHESTSAQEDYTIDIKSLAQDWISHPSTNY